MCAGIQGVPWCSSASRWCRDEWIYSCWNSLDWTLARRCRQSQTALLTLYLCLSVWQASHWPVIIIVCFRVSIMWHPAVLDSPRHSRVLVSRPGRTTSSWICLFLSLAPKIAYYGCGNSSLIDKLLKLAGMRTLARCTSAPTPATVILTLNLFNPKSTGLNTVSTTSQRVFILLY